MTSGKHYRNHRIIELAGLSAEMSALVFAPPLEVAALQLAADEELIAREKHWRRHSAGDIDPVLRSYLLANLFLHPEVKLSPRYELEVPVRTPLLRFDQSRTGEDGGACEDMALIIAYARALDPSLTVQQIGARASAYCETHAAVEQLFGGMPLSNGEGRPIMLQDMVVSAIERSPPTYSGEQLAAYAAYHDAKADAATILGAFADINGAWRLRTANNPVSLHPKLSRDFRQILAGDVEAGEVSESDIFFLTVKALRTLPVGRTLAETLELSASREGRALRARIAELHGELMGGAINLSALAARIEADADSYRMLTSRLHSPNILSGVVDIVLSGLGLIPVIGTASSVISLSKSSWATYSTVKVRSLLNSMAWGGYQGRSI